MNIIKPNVVSPNAPTRGAVTFAQALSNARRVARGARESAAYPRTDDICVCHGAGSIQEKPPVMHSHHALPVPFTSNCGSDSVERGPVMGARPSSGKAGPAVRQTVVGAFSLLCALVPLSGCMVGPDFKKPQVTVPQSWSAKADPLIATQTTVDSLWWKSFADPILDQLIDRAYRENLTLQVAGLRILEARAQLGIASGKQWPQLQEAFGSAAAVGLSSTAPNTKYLPSLHFGDYQVGFDAAWELDFWGKYRRGVEAESAAALASVADYYEALVALTAEVARTYVVIRTTEVLIAQAMENVRLQEQGLDIAQSRFRNGATSELDPTQAKTLLESTRASVPPLQTELEQARNALNTLLGVPTGTVDAMLAAPPGIPKAPAKVAIGVPAELLRRRPDIRSAEFSAAAQCARIGVAKAELYPSLSIVGTIGLETSSGAGATNVLAAGSLFYSLGPQIHWAFLNYGRIENSVRVQDARFQELLVGYRNIVLKAIQEVEDALSGFLNSNVATAPAEGAVQAAQRAVTISVAQYREGEVDYQRVLDSERELLQQQTSLTQTVSSVSTNLIALYKALGGGWELAQGEPVVPDPTRQEMKARTNWGDMLSRPRPIETATDSSPQHR
jgi:NodT family efflux transporter outer membrane factor (OMF) lipoprotein